MGLTGELLRCYDRDVYNPMNRISEPEWLVEVSYLEMLERQNKDIPQATLPGFVLSEPLVEEVAQRVEYEFLSKSETSKEVQTPKPQYVSYVKPKKELSGITFNDNFGFNPFGDISDLSVDWD